METFDPGDRVVAINTDMSRPMHDPTGSPLSAFSFPDGPLRRDVIYHVASVHPQAPGQQGLFITGLRVFLRNQPIPWNSSRFRKVDQLSGHSPAKRRRKQPAAARACATC
jgi:hypothetical protein